MTEPAILPVPSLPPLTDQSALPVLFVHLDAGRGRLSWKPRRKGGRWHSGCRGKEEVMRQAQRDGLPSVAVIEFVEARR